MPNTMEIAHTEYYINTGNPVTTANVYLRHASLAHPNTTPIVATTSTNASGYWEFLALDDGYDYDVEVALAGVSRWYKGLAKNNARISPNNFGAVAPRTMLVGPASGGSLRPTFRVMASDDLPLCIKTDHYFGDIADPTKMLHFNTSLATPNFSTLIRASHTSNRTLDLPDVSDFLATRNTAETLSNKTLNSPVLVTPSIAATGWASANHSHYAANSGGHIFNDRCAVYASGPQNINSGTPTTLGFDGEIEDTAGMHPLGAGNSQIAAPRAGLYLVYANIRWAVDASGYREAYIWIGGTTNVARAIQMAVGGGNWTEQNLSAWVTLAAGQYVEVRVQHNSTTNPLAVLTQAGSPPAFGMAFHSS